MWVTDGTGAGTVPVKDINPGVGSGTHPFGGYYSEFPQMEGVGDHLYFFAAERVHSWGVWRSDGTGSDTVKLLDVLPGVKHALLRARLDAAGDTAFLWISSPDGSRSKLWRSDATATAMTLVTSIAHPTCLWASAVGSDLLFGVYDGKHCVLWKTDGTAPGTDIVRKIYPVTNRQGFTEAGSDLFFDAADGVHGVELWRTDGSRGGTTLIADIAPGAASSKPRSMLFVAA